MSNPREQNVFGHAVELVAADRYSKVSPKTNLIESGDLKPRDVTGILLSSCRKLGATQGTENCRPQGPRRLLVPEEQPRDIPGTCASQMLKGNRC